MTKSERSGTIFETTFHSAAIFGGHVRPRIELPAISFERDESAKPHGKNRFQVELIPGLPDAVEEHYLGVVTPEHVLLVLPPGEFERLSKRVGSILQKPLPFELEVDEHRQLVALSVDGEPVHLPRQRST